MTLILQQPWTRQPQRIVGVDWDNPLTQGLAFLVLPGFAFDASRQIPLGTITTSRFGASALFSSTATTESVSFGQRNPLGPLSNSTVFAVASTKAGLLPGLGGSAGDGLIGSGGNAIYCERASSGNDIYKLCIVDVGTGAQAEFTYRNDGGTLLQQRVSDSTLNNGDLFAAAVVKDGTSHTVYSRNSSSTGTFGSGSTAFTNSNQMLIGNDANDDKSTWNGVIALVAGWRRSLSAAEIAQLQANPWQLFEPRRILIPASVAASIYTLSNATYVPGSITASGVTPRVTVTVA